MTNQQIGLFSWSDNNFGFATKIFQQENIVVAGSVERERAHPDISGEHVAAEKRNVVKRYPTLILSEVKKGEACYPVLV